MKEKKSIPQVSVVVPMYNCELFIEDCLESLKAQTLKNFEALCIDDGSTDKTLALAQACVAGDSRFSIIVLEENQGQSVARNRALDQATGIYIVLLDADDCLVDTALDDMYQRAEAQQLDDLYFAAQSVYESEELRSIVREDLDERPAFEGVATGKELFTFFEERDQFFPHAALRMVKRSLIEENNIRFYEGIIHEDALFTFQTLVVSKRSSYLDKVLYMRRIRAGSTMTTTLRKDRSVRGHFLCVREMKRWMHERADELEASFIAAMMHRIDVFVQLAAHDWSYSLDKEEQRVFLDSLSPSEKIDFFADIAYRGEQIKECEEEYLTSKTFRLGNALIRGPRFIKNAVTKRKQQR